MSTAGQCNHSRASKLSPGVLTEHQLACTTQIGYFAYVPVNLQATQPPFVFVHGYSRRAREHAEALIPLCEELGCALLAPLFAKDEHPRYQRLGRGRDGQRSDRVLDACIEDLFGRNVGPIYLSGFSGGAQFAHRYTMAHPSRVARLVVVAAGWYTLPSATLRYPLGLHTRQAFRGITLNPERFLKVPTTVIVGDQDTGYENLRRSPELDMQQGITRVLRARNWTAHMRLAAKSHRLESLVRYLEIPGIGHDFEEFVHRGRLLALLRESLTTEFEKNGKSPSLATFTNLNLSANVRVAQLV
ncbi:MAG: pimeloyl-ACP methyl ester carboxylesterase [Halieaceae bacterium]|jgi:pimeloyl-ACP methyl ester carboxylesterase